MQDKLIEAAQHVVDEMERGYPIIGPVCQLKEVLAALRAHDAGTDEEVIAYRARQIWRRFVGIPITEPYTAEFQWLLDLLSGNEAPKKTLTEAVQEARGNLEPPTVPIRFASPASHAAESAPPLISEGCAYHGASSRICERGTGGCEIHHAAESAPVSAAPECNCLLSSQPCNVHDKRQPAAAQPVEDVVNYPKEVFCGAVWAAFQKAAQLGYGLIDQVEAAAQAARKGYVKLEEALGPMTEDEVRRWPTMKRPEDCWYDLSLNQKMNVLLEDRRARLAPKPSPDPIQEVIATAICNECGARVGKRELHLKWHAALFPKTGGAK